jgi:hypothetical protein
LPVFDPAQLMIDFANHRRPFAARADARLFGQPAGVVADAK